MGVKWRDLEEEATGVGERKVRDLPKVKKSVVHNMRKKWEIKDNDNK